MDYLGLSLVISGYLGLSQAISGYLWLGFIWLSLPIANLGHTMAISGNLGQTLAISDYIQLFTAIYIKYQLMMFRTHRHDQIIEELALLIRGELNGSKALLYK